MTAAARPKKCAWGDRASNDFAAPNRHRDGASKLKVAGRAGGPHPRRSAARVPHIVSRQGQSCAMIERTGSLASPANFAEA
jgi:hypothetical protein